LHRTIYRALGGDQNDGNSLSLFGEMSEQLNPTHPWHFQIGDDNGWGPLDGLFQALRSVSSCLHAIPPGGRQFCQAGALVLFILNNQ